MVPIVIGREKERRREGEKERRIHNEKNELFALILCALCVK